MDGKISSSQDGSKMEFYDDLFNIQTDKPPRLVQPSLAADGSKRLRSAHRGSSESLEEPPKQE